METLKFEQIPDTVCRIFEKLCMIEQMLQNQNVEAAVDVEELLTVKKAALFLNLKDSTIYGLVRDSKIPSFKKGNRLYFSKTELTNWVKSGRKLTKTDVYANAHNNLSVSKRGGK